MGGGLSRCVCRLRRDSPSAATLDHGALFDRHRNGREELSKQTGGRALIQTVVDCIAPRPGETACDSA